MGQVVIGTADIGTVKGKLQHFHVGIATVTNQLTNALGHSSQIFGDDTTLTKAIAQDMEQFHAGTLLPTAVLGAGGIGRDSKILVKALNGIFLGNDTKYQADFIFV